MTTTGQESLSILGITGQESLYINTWNHYHWSGITINITSIQVPYLSVKTMGSNKCMAPNRCQGSHTALLINAGVHLVWGI